MSISTTVKTIQDIMRKDAGVDGDAQRISQLVWMLFLKIFDDREYEYELIEENYVSPIPEHLRWRNWANDPEGITENELLNFVNNDLFKTLKDLSFSENSNPRGFVVREVFEDSYNYMKNGALIRQVVNKINEINFKDSNEKHLFGDVYEKILKDLQSAGNAGEFYTPRAVTDFMVQMVNPKIGEKILDPACGTGGFLISSIEHLKKEGKIDEGCHTLQKYIYGTEKKPLPHLLCVTNMMLHGIDVPSQIRRANSLERPLQDYKSADKMDVIITNPPFGGTEENGIERGFPLDFQTRETADLFLVLIIDLLKDNGRGAIVLPDGTLFGEGVKTRIKEKLLNDCNLHTIVRLPNGVFSPYTGIKTNLLFFTKGASTKEIWYYEHPYPDGHKSYSKTKPLEFQEFEPEKSWWNNRKENKFAWKVSIEDIKANNYNLNIKNPHEELTDHGDPEELLKAYKSLLLEISEIRNTLKAELISALKGKKRMKSNSFFENFEILIESPNGIQKCREMILQMAVQGKLVEQNLNDEPAEVLFERIKAENTKLVKEGKVRDSKPLPAIKETEHLFKIPKTWKWVRLGDLGDWGAGATPNRAKLEYYDGSINWFKSGELNDGYIFDSNEKINTLALKECSLRLNSPGDVLIAMYGATIGKVAILKTEGTTNQAICACTCYDGCYNEYLFLLLKAYRKYLMSQSSGGAQPNISRQKIIHTVSPLPPLEEQKRIVKEVNILISLCNQLGKKIINGQKSAEILMDSFLIEAVRGF